MREPLQDLYTNSRLLILDFSQIPASTPSDESIEHFFTQAAAHGKNPRQPQYRQAFNNRLLQKTGNRYLISRYGEDRLSMLQGSSIAQEGRTIHLGVDIFSQELETIYAPCKGIVVRSGHEPEDHSFGYYVIIQPDHLLDTYVFLGHLAKNVPAQGTRVTAGESIAQLGDFAHNENGGWSRHLHLQMLGQLPPKGQAPIGYSSATDFALNVQRYPDPRDYFPELY